MRGAWTWGIPSQFTAHAPYCPMPQGCPRSGAQLMPPDECTLASVGCARILWILLGPCVCRSLFAPSCVLGRLAPLEIYKNTRAAESQQRSALASPESSTFRAENFQFSVRKLKLKQKQIEIFVCWLCVGCHCSNKSHIATTYRFGRLRGRRVTVLGSSAPKNSPYLPSLSRDL